jgi:hypothetical protein
VEHKILFDFVMNLMSYHEMKSVTKQRTFKLKSELRDVGTEGRKVNETRLLREGRKKYWQELL